MTIRQIRGSKPAGCQEFPGESMVRCGDMFYSSIKPRGSAFRGSLLISGLKQRIALKHEQGVT